MNLVQLKNILEATGYPVAYSHFTESVNNPVPNPPFICYLVIDSAHFNADNTVYYPIQNINIELYTDKKDLEAEGKLEAVLNDNQIPFGTTEIFIESENLFQKTYEVRLI